ncbi:tetratricopeptide repeat protein [Oscillatoriales cyanobacterium LEGE 11467]|uniref:Tetratricopeptide repeat protein n=1 Tax=Zarconia navalis LEGE 11467 TaxID=1828826 RepID=A0A928VTE4_9CYAN|nr:Sll0314/Alr1548 family TPR repeat-containing protein [Zarconia navalis]MBE9039816.1 tetratricopeptide repeat protein [Zarconia navalis LEGE 11467]
MNEKISMLGSIASGIVGSAVFVLGTWVHPVQAANPFCRDASTCPEYDMGSQAREGFDAMFRDGNYDRAKKAAEGAIVAESDDPITHAMQASLVYLYEDGWDRFKTHATDTRETAEALIPTNPLRGNLYAAVGYFLEGAHTLQTEGTVRGTPAALSKLRQVFGHLEEAEKIDPSDPELNIIKGFMDLMLAVNLPLANPEDSLDRLAYQAGPDYLAYRGLAIGYRDLNRPQEALTEVQNALAITPDNPEVQYLQAQIYVENGDYEQSLDWFKKAWEKRAQLPNDLKKQIKRECNKAQREVNPNRADSERLCQDDES